VLVEQRRTILADRADVRVARIIRLAISQKSIDVLLIPVLAATQLAVSIAFRASS
jgi:hypothetical protein